MQDAELHDADYRGCQVIDLCNVPRIVRRCECGKPLAQCNRGDQCFVCQQRVIDARMRGRFEPEVKEPEVKRVYRSRMPSEQRRKEILEGMKRMSMHDTARHFHVALHTVVTIVKESGSRPNCPHGCGKPYHPGMCKFHPKYNSSTNNLTIGRKLAAAKRKAAQA